VLLNVGLQLNGRSGDWHTLNEWERIFGVLNGNLIENLNAQLMTQTLDGSLQIATVHFWFL
jgi:hypothetical protein